MALTPGLLLITVKILEGHGGRKATFYRPFGAEGGRTLPSTVILSSAPELRYTGFLPNECSLAGSGRESTALPIKLPGLVWDKVPHVLFPSSSWELAVIWSETDPCTILVTLIALIRAKNYVHALLGGSK